ncbi:hypothetical protein A0H81_14167 [Grifola frondosa]|uniref:Uncharacterized protein n=1 Tax=Grifola frondosa TaxID=5627 RepID=A0A1C7LT38_GRIFR|nr:hypothetical protein A0H81_14167 [Grifola frondosa]
MNKLLMQICVNLSKDSTFALSSVCRALHYFALPFYFKLVDFCIPLEGQSLVSITKSSFHMLDIWCRYLPQRYFAGSPTQSKMQ